MAKTPSEILRYEHDLHRRMLGVLAIVTSRIMEDELLDVEDTQCVLTYFTDFVEGLHQTKEYEFLYPAAAMMEFAGAAERVGRLIAEQRHTKMLFDSLCSLGDPAELDADEREGFVKLAQAYSARLRWQMEREEEVLVLLGEFLGDEEADDMLDQFARAEKKQRNPVNWEREVARLESVCGLSADR